MPISIEKENALLDWMKRLGVSEEDLQETFIRSSGPGGQKVNKTATCVYLVHVPSGQSVKCQKTRSQATNRFLARRILLDRLERLQKGRASEERKRIEKLKRQKRKRSKRAKEKMLQAKHRHSEKKALRSRVPPAAAD
ncbi:MAG TPA: peptide chain release factor-like protein [Syntrophales bacterium]|jgi:protein subunit release factor B|nr:peptide chain release factor-like protein [Syntrophales bacterium]HRT62672.1 peptide chain release factor-like protein [Syntrophales bacterium]